MEYKNSQTTTIKNCHVSKNRCMIFYSGFLVLGENKKS